MPYKPKQYCKSPGCNQLVDSGYCEKHKQPATQQEIDRHSHDNKVYGNTTWRRLRRIKLNANPLCEICLRDNKIVQASQVDHIIPVKVQPELKLVYENLQSLCETHHSQKTREENKHNCKC